MEVRFVMVSLSVLVQLYYIIPRSKRRNERCKLSAQHENPSLGFWT